MTNIDGLVLRLVSLFSRSDLGLVAIDADDTLWHDGRYYSRVDQHFIQCCTSTGMRDRVALECIAAIDRHGLRGEKEYADAIQFVAARLGIGEAFLAPLRQTCQEFLVHEIEMLPFAREVIAELRGFRLALVTKGRPEEQRSKVDRTGVAQFFAEVVVLSAKNVETWREAFARVGLEPKRALVIGNNFEDDIRPTAMLGAATIWLNHPENPFAVSEDPPPSEVLVVEGWSPILAALDALRTR